METNVFTRALSGYIECALWSSLDADGEPLDATHDEYDLCQDAQDAMSSDVRDFLALIETERSDIWKKYILSDPSQIGHDFWLTRNRHGAGFWDRGWSEPGDWLTTMAHSYGEAYLEVCDDGKIHLY